MKKIIIPILTISFLISLIAIISTSFINYNVEIKSIIFKAMYFLLGILYMLNGSASEKKGHRIIFLICGIVLIVIGFINRSIVINLITVAVILTPIIVSRIAAKPNT